MKLLLALSILVLLAGCAGTTTTTTATTAATQTTPGGGVGTSPAGTSGTGSGAKTVELYDNYFEDGNLTLAADSSVTYKNMGTHGHTVTVHWVGDPVTTYKLDQTLQPGGSVSFTFSPAGTYHVWCRFHGAMTSGMATVVHAT
ncbi:MAG: Cupredoxin-like domain [Thermoplasmata archaeon]|jgi:plastocyanin|nr:Cupredoxin-like domain [Thermoplasmata archaeon]